MKKILLFTGAGMSVPMGLPAATGFSDTVEKCHPDLLRALESHLGDDIHDIEKILYSLEEFMTGSSFYKHILYINRNENSFGVVNNFVNNYIEYARRFQQIIKHDIFKMLQQFDANTALNIYKNLLTAFQIANGEFSLSIFTTNYDLIFEDTVSDNPEVFEYLGYDNFYYGFTEKWNKVRFDKSQDFEWSSKIIEYNKLHGSLDWSKDTKGVVVKTGVNTSPSEPDNMPLLYPGYKGTPNDEPFISMHNKLYLRLIQCDYAYVIGFAFRDPYINSIFEFALRANLNY